MDPIIKQLAASMGISTSGSYNRASDGTSLLPRIKPVPSETSSVLYTSQSASVPRAEDSEEADKNWNIA